MVNNNIEKTKLFSVIRGLKTSVVVLNNTICRSYNILQNKKSASRDIIEKLQYYKEIVKKQQALILELEQLALNDETDKISNIVYKINTMSKFIREDSQNVIFNLHSVTKSKAATIDKKDMH